MASKVIILTGAPPYSSLDWDHGSLLDEFEPSLAWFLGIVGEAGQPQASSQSGLNNPAPSSASLPEWRSLPLEDVVARDIGPDVQGGGFFSVAQAALALSLDGQSVGTAEQEEERVSQVFTEFCEHSLAIDHDGAGNTTGHDSHDSHGGSFVSVSGSEYDNASPSTAPGADHQPKPPFMDHLTPAQLTKIGAIPSAAHIAAKEQGRKRQQQQQQQNHRQHSRWAFAPLDTINLIAGVISVERPRVVRTNRGAAMYLVEILLGDETRSGLGISCWHSSLSAAEGMVGRVRRRDVVLVQDAALGVFMGKVYGRSIRPGAMGFKGTRVQVLYRQEGSEGEGGGYYSTMDLKAARQVGEDGWGGQLARTRAVAQWVQRFVAVGTAGGRAGHGGVREHDEVYEKPPADSQ